MRALQGSKTRKLMSTPAGERMIRNIHKSRKLPSGTKVTAHPDAAKNIAEFINNLAL